MSAPDVRARIAESVAREVHDALHTASAPLSLRSVTRACPSAADVADVRPVLRRLCDEGTVARDERHDGQPIYRLVATRPARQRRGAASTPNGRAGRIVPLVAHIGHWMSAGEVAAGLDEDKIPVMKTLSYLAHKERLAVRHRDRKHKEYGLPGWVETPVAAVTDHERRGDAPEAETAPHPGDVIAAENTRRLLDEIARPEEPARAPSAGTESDRPPPRFGLWSDGCLAIEAGERQIDLAPDETRALVAYLDRIREPEAGHA